MEASARRDTIWKPPESVSRFRGHLRDGWRFLHRHRPGKVRTEYVVAMPGTVFRAEVEGTRRGVSAPHEGVETPHGGQDLLAGAQAEVVGVGQDDVPVGGGGGFTPPP